MTTEEIDSIWFDALSISVSKNSWVDVSPGKIDKERLLKLEGNRYDQAPVIADGQRVIGLVDTTHLRTLIDQQKFLEENDSAIKLTKIPEKIGLLDLLSVLANNRAVLVETSTGIDGLLTVSDLNRHQFRSILYSLLADVEIALAEVINKNCPKLDDWIKCLSEEGQVRVLGFWEVSRRFKVDIGPLPGCTLTELISIIECVDDLVKLLGYESRAKAKKGLGGIPKFRNTIMHPIRPLVLNQTDVMAVCKSVESVEDLRQRLKVIGFGAENRVGRMYLDHKA